MAKRVLGNELASAIEHLYKAFGKYSRPKVVYRSPVIPGPPDLVLVTKALRDLTYDDLMEFASNAPLTYGTDDDLKYFLPRTLELCATSVLSGESSFVGGVACILLNTLRADLSSEELGAIRTYATELFHQAFVNIPPGRIEYPALGAPWIEALEAAGLVGVDLVPLLNGAFSESTSLDVRATEIVRLIEQRGRYLGAGEGGWPWWKGPGSDAVDLWLIENASKQMSAALEAFPKHRNREHWLAGERLFNDLLS